MVTKHEKDNVRESHPEHKYACYCDDFNFMYNDFCLYCIYTGKANKPRKNAPTIKKVHVVIDHIKREDGSEFQIVHVHATAERAEKFIKENKKEDPDAKFTVHECVVQSED